MGPAGTGKTYLAVAMAVSALMNKQVARIILTRPAVEAGERLGFLPGTLQEKVDPYLRPLYDALYDMLESERVEKLLERNVIEVAPIAFMRGRTLNDSFIILDEAQNTHRRADEDGAHAPGLQLQDGGERRHHADRPAHRPAQRLDGCARGAQGRGRHQLRAVRRAATWCATPWCSASSRPTSGTTRSIGRRAGSLPLKLAEPAGTRQRPGRGRLRTPEARLPCHLPMAVQ